MVNPVMAGSCEDEDLDRQRQKSCDGKALCWLADFLSAFGLTRTSDEDLCSQFNYLWSSLLVTAMGLFITLIQYTGNPIECWCPAELPEVQCNYTKALCWVKQNYYVHEDQDVNQVPDERYSMTIAYYPWVPWILFFVAAIMKLPHYVWHSFAHSSGLNLIRLIDLANGLEETESLAKIVQLWLVRNSEPPRSTILSKVKHYLGSAGCFWFGKKHKTYLAGLILFTKLTYLLVSIGVHMSLNFFIEEDFLWYGYEVFESYIKGIPQISARFPVQTLCDMEIRLATGINRYSIQCILPINRYSEKIFIFLWFWLLMQIIVNAWSLFKWGLRLLSPTDRRRFVQIYVEITLHLQQQRKTRMVKRLGHDGIVVFRTLEDAVGIVMANQIFQALYEQLTSTLHYS
ncbi:LOW QUALITY PROTEIN: innexin-11-like [Physella acuta]|uniref:LOW QUALITY PROTEIN: innexin-11-like n=1 Tax=Physella acuta TaxID=109671 RepID=UPI0027DD6AAB|nr:LOW QUALITY PROTEIN: innexin-11-like [Physella acuta]